MRTYSHFAPQFWTGTTGRHLRTLGPETQVVACYLITCPSANMIGLYYLPLPVIVHETGLSLATVRESLQKLSSGSLLRQDAVLVSTAARIGAFAFYDEDTETVWVPEMARFQIGESMKPFDNRRQSVRREALSYSKSPFYAAFVSRYSEPFSLNLGAPAAILSEAPPKPLRSPSEAPLDPGAGAGAGIKDRPPTVGAAAPSPAALTPQQEAVERAWAIFDRYETARPKASVIVSWRRELKGDTDRLCRILEDQGPRGCLDKGQAYIFAVIRGEASGNGKPAGKGDPQRGMEKGELEIARQSAAMFGMSLKAYLRDGPPEGHR